MEEEEQRQKYGELEGAFHLFLFLSNNAQIHLGEEPIRLTSLTDTLHLQFYTFGQPNRRDKSTSAGIVVQYGKN